MKIKLLISSVVTLTICSFGLLTVLAADATPQAWSAWSTSTMNFKDAILYCNNLDESGHQDWYLPTQAQVNMDKVNYMVGKSSNYGWTRTPHTSGNGDWMRLTLSNGGWISNGYSDFSYVRCVR